MNALTHLTFRQIDAKHAADLNIPNEPFELIGQFMPAFSQGAWSYDLAYFETPTTMVFPEENYDFAAMTERFLAIGAYLEDICIGLALLEHSPFKYMYLYDLKINSAYRANNIGTALMTASKNAAKAAGYKGIYTIAQDNNLKACLFYLKNGLEIGGVNTHVYKGTKQEDKINIYFYESSE